MPEPLHQGPRESHNVSMVHVPTGTFHTHAKILLLLLLGSGPCLNISHARASSSDSSSSSSSSSSSMGGDIDNRKERGYSHVRVHLLLKGK